MTGTAERELDTAFPMPITTTTQTRSAIGATPMAAGSGPNSLARTIPIANMAQAPKRAHAVRGLPCTPVAEAVATHAPQSPTAAH
jgi:hypothetical protein